MWAPHPFTERPAASHTRRGPSERESGQHLTREPARGCPQPAPQERSLGAAPPQEHSPRTCQSRRTHSKHEQTTTRPPLPARGEGQSDGQSLPLSPDTSATLPHAPPAPGTAAPLPSVTGYQHPNTDTAPGTVPGISCPTALLPKPEKQPQCYRAAPPGSRRTEGEGPGSADPRPGGGSSCAPRPAPHQQRARRAVDFRGPRSAQTTSPRSQEGERTSALAALLICNRFKSPLRSEPIPAGNINDIVPE